ncbi:MAG TPA: hypothetical protein VHC22_09330 [Pirellulales bacterium]|nr:hypothetical protein [Pirellulales bacterium]
MAGSASWRAAFRGRPAEDRDSQGRRWQFSLRRLVIGVTMSCCLAAVVLRYGEFLSFEGCPITDAGLDRFAPFRALRSVNLFHTQVTAAGVAKLQRSFPKLAVLGAQGNRLPALGKAGE